MEKAKQSAVCKRAMAVKARSAITVLAVAGVFVFCGREPAHAGLPGLQLQYSPDIYASFVSSAYDADTQEFVASGVADSYRYAPNSSVDFDMGSTFEVIANVDAMGNASGGALTVTGGLSEIGIGGDSQTLLKGSLTDFAFDVAGSVIEMLFTVTGGALATAGHFGLPGTTIGTILHVNDAAFTGFGSSWATSFFPAGAADTGLPVGPEVPEPGLAGLVLMTLCAWLWRRRCS